MAKIHNPFTLHKSQVTEVNTEEKLNAVLDEIENAIDEYKLLNPDVKHIRVFSPASSVANRRAVPGRHDDDAVVPLKVGRAVRLTEADPTIVIPLAKSIAIMMIALIETTVIAAVMIIVLRTAEVHRGIEIIVMGVHPRAIVIMDHRRDIVAVNDCVIAGIVYRDISLSLRGLFLFVVSFFLWFFPSR